MSADFQIPFATVKVGKNGKHGSFTVRGFNADDVVFITTTYLEDLKKVLARYGGNQRIAKNRVADLVMEVVKDFPMLVAEIISRCADAPEKLEQFRNLSFVKQLEAMQRIIELSTDDDEGELLKKAGAGLVSLLEANGLQLGPLSAKLRTIITGSGSLSQSSE